MISHSPPSYISSLHQSKTTTVSGVTVASKSLCI